MPDWSLEILLQHFSIVAAFECIEQRSPD
ncbi:hypothetical protein CUMW_209780 [Citrus unshiu]|uniref:Uncharacterized protein n=1 Tax=Citrus unshiu TaxID=55188 RepID=A0A2H5PZ93_CITUN|nr:hypothetical protein CUMW_181410 [Citrus unshiu]GAY61414.1 hypothetical protein CUMW_209780 [Citrus unshiu]